MRNVLILIASVLLLVLGCDKSIELEDRTDISISVERDQFYDTLYYVSNLNVTSTNDEILQSAYIKLTDEAGNLVLSGDWKSLRGSTISLYERREYSLSMEVFLSAESNEVVYDRKVTIDNIKYPKHLRVKQIVINDDVLDPDSNGLTVSNAHITLLRAYNHYDFTFDKEEYFDDESLLYFQRQFPPRTTTFNQEFDLPLRTYQNEDWKIHEVFVGYPIAISGSVVDQRRVMFKINILELMQTLGTESNNEHTIETSDSSNGGAYTGTLKFEWIYE